MTQQTLPTRRRAGKPNCYKTEVRGHKFYAFFVSKYGTGKKTGVTRDVYAGVITEFMQWVQEELVKGEKFFLPFSLGTLEVEGKDSTFYTDENGKVITKYLRVDWNSTWKFWTKNPEAFAKKKVLYFTNEDTDGTKYRIVWNRTKKTGFKTNNYSFKPNRLLSRKLADYIRDPNTPKNYSKC